MATILDEASSVILDEAGASLYDEAAVPTPDWLNVVSYGADPTGVTDSTTAIQAAISALPATGGVVYVPSGTYMTLAPITLPPFATLLGDARGLGVPTDNYGVAGIAIAGSILKPSGSFSGSAVLLMDNTPGTSQMGNQQILGISIDGSGMSTNTANGIESIGPVATVTIRDCTIYKVGGNGIYASLNASHQHANSWDCASLRIAECGAWGCNLPGTSDSTWVDCWVSDCTSGNWMVLDQANSKYVGCKAEWSGSGPGWLLKFASNAGYVTLSACSSEFNGQDGYQCAGSVAGVIILDGCRSVGDGHNSGSGGGGYAGLRVAGCASKVIADNLTVLTRTSPSAPQYGVAQVSSSTGTVTLTASNLQGATAVTYDDGSNTRVVVCENGTGWANVLTWGADPAGAADSTTAINAALAFLPAGGGTVYFPAGTYKVSGALNVPTGAVLQGAGEDAAIIKQTSTTADTLLATDQRYITVQNLQLTGPSSGTGRGIAFLHSAATVAGINLTNVIVQNFGGDGIHLETVITSALTKVRSQSNGGHGFLANNGTSVSWKACYSNANTGNGYEIDAMAYCQLDSCAADNVAIGYSINGCSAIVLNGCGTEQPVSGYKVLGGSANIVLQGCRVLGETGIGFWVTGSSTFCFMLGCREQSPGAGATASFQVDSGSAAVVIDPQSTTANNYAAGTVCLFQPTNLEIHSSSSATARVSRGATTNTGRYTLQTGNSDRWALQLNSDSTDNVHLTDLTHTLDALVAVYQATQPNLGLLTGSGSGSYGGGTGVVFIANDSTDPSSNPTGGGILFVSGGALKYRGSSGTVTTIASA